MDAVAHGQTWNRHSTLDTFEFRRSRLDVPSNRLVELAHAPDAQGVIITSPFERSCRPPEPRHALYAATADDIDQQVDGFFFGRGRPEGEIYVRATAPLQLYQRVNEGRDALVRLLRSQRQAWDRC